MVLLKKIQKILVHLTLFTQLDANVTTNQNPAAHSCQCKECGNPFGVRPIKQGFKRKRRPHSLQLVLPSSKKFALDRGESLSTSLWSDFESIVLNEILNVVEEGNAQSDVTKLYNDTVYYSKSSFCAFPVMQNIVFREKTKQQINSKIQISRQE